jgi:hypothetical protein
MITTLEWLAGVAAERTLTEVMAVPNDDRL